MPHYSNSEDPVGVIVSNSTDTVNRVAIGGGSGAVNNATEVLICAAANQTTTGTNAIVTVNSTGATISGDLTVNGSVSATSIDLYPYCVTGSGTQVQAAATIQDLSVVQVSHSNYSLANDTITVSSSGTYKISYGVRVDEDSTSGGTRGRVTAYMTGSSLGIITQSYVGVYTRESSGGTGLSNSFNVTLPANETLSLYIDQDGNNTPDLSSENIQVSILKVG